MKAVLPDLIDGFKNDTIEDAKGVRMGDTDSYIQSQAEIQGNNKLANR